MAAKLFDNFDKDRLFDTRHSQRVKRLRTALPIAILIIAAFLILWPIFMEEKIPDSEQSTQNNNLNNQQTMLNPVFQGIDQKQRPYIIKAEKVTKLSKDSAALRLQSTDSTLYTSTDQSEWLNVNSHFGTYDPNEQSLTLEGNVTLSDWQGLQVTTQEISIGLKTKTAKSTSQITGENDKFSLNATGLDITDHGKNIIFQGPATLRLKPSNKRAKSTP